MTPCRPAPPPASPYGGGGAELSAGFREAIDEAAPEIAAELSALLGRAIDLSSAGTPGPTMVLGHDFPGPEPEPGRPAGSVTVGFQGGVTGRGALQLDTTSLGQMLAWLPAGPGSSGTCGPRAGAADALSPPALGPAPAADDGGTSDALSDPLIRCAVLEIGSVILGGVLGAYARRCSSRTTFTPPYWQGPLSAAHGNARSILKGFFVPLRLACAHRWTVVWLQFFLQDPGETDPSGERRWA